MYLPVLISVFAFSMIPGVFASVEEDILNEHNRLRRLHRSPDLQLVPYVPDQVHSAANNITEEDKEPPYVRDFPLSVCKTLGDPVKCVQQWYDGVKDYDFDNPGFSDETKYFTALIWKASNHLAVLTKTNQISKNKYVFAFYHPLGNIDGKFKENVPRLNGSPLSVNLFQINIGIVLLCSWFINKMLA